MSTQLTTEQQLEIQVKDLKSRILDTQDALQRTQGQAQELVNALTEIVQALELQPNESGQVQVADVIAGVKAMAEELELLKTPVQVAE